jgi:hypothetical protein
MRRRIMAFAYPLGTQRHPLIAKELDLELADEAGARPEPLRNQTAERNVRSRGVRPGCRQDAGITAVLSRRHVVEPRPVCPQSDPHSLRSRYSRSGKKPTTRRVYEGLPNPARHAIPRPCRSPAGTEQATPHAHDNVASAHSAQSPMKTRERSEPSVHLSAKTRRRCSPRHSGPGAASAMRVGNSSSNDVERFRSRTVVP